MERYELRATGISIYRFQQIFEDYFGSVLEMTKRAKFESLSYAMSYCKDIESHGGRAIITEMQNQNICYETD